MARELVLAAISLTWACGGRGPATGPAVSAAICDYKKELELDPGNADAEKMLEPIGH